MHAAIADLREELATLCRHHGVTRLEVFGSAARCADFDPQRSDADFLVSFTPEALLGRSVDLVDREAVEASRDYIRRRRILAEAEAVYE